MSAPAFAWALERGAALKLLPADRLVLLYLADKANGERVCWPSQDTIVRFTGLAPRTVRTAIHRLNGLQLIRVDGSPGKVPHYHILRPTPANGAGVETEHPGKSCLPTPANRAVVDGATPANRAWVTPAPFAPTPAPFARTPANRAPEPSYNQEEPSKSARARAEAEDLKSRNGMGTPWPVLTLVATTACEQQTEAETVPVPDEQMAAQLAALAAKVARGFKTNYPPRASSLSPEEQRDLAGGAAAYRAEPRASYLTGPHLAMLRRQAGIGVAPS